MRCFMSQSLPKNSVDHAKTYLGFRATASYVSTGMFCFFIDGLGEYHGPEETILKVVKSLTAARNIKICASSRPWPAFCAEWNSSVFTFKMQDLSRDDMTRYVKEHLESSQDFRQAASGYVYI
ncbi:hypothetical protein F4801DRAFT_538383 [Xylaria longipes]|nr:hypothetical protein F4801DRAFT_538383 [Xylaria longipes]